MLYKQRPIAITEHGVSSWHIDTSWTWVQIESVKPSRADKGIVSRTKGDR